MKRFRDRLHNTVHHRISQWGLTLRMFQVHRHTIRQSAKQSNATLKYHILFKMYEILYIKFDLYYNM